MGQTRTKVKHRNPPALVAPKGGAGTAQEGPYERARKRLDTLNDPDALPVPPTEVLALKSTRALEDWEDLMLVQDVELWGASDLSLAAQLVCLQELARSMQFEVQVIGREFEFDRWGTAHLSVQYQMWKQTLQQIDRLHGSFTREQSVADANRRAKKVMQTGAAAIAKAQAPEPPLLPPGPVAGTDLTA